MPKNVQKSNTHTLREGNVVVAERPNTANWQMRIKIPDGSWKYESSKTSDLEEAKQRAIDMYDNFKFRAKNDLTIEETRKFEAVAKVYEAELLSLEEAGAGKKIHETYLQHLRKWLIPFFGKKNLHDIDQDFISQYDTYLRNSLGREPAKSTINSHNTALRAVFDLAVHKKYIKRNELPIFSVKGKGRIAKRRPAFDKAEWNALTNFMNSKWQTGSKLWLSNYKRQVLRIYVLVLGNTGIRTGVEMSNLKWKDITEEKLTKKKIQARQEQGQREAGSETYLRFRVKGKTSVSEAEGFRNVIARDAVKGWLKQLTEIGGYPSDDKNAYVFSMPDGSQIKDLPNMFTTLLEQADLRYDTQGEPRTLYSMRHMYATMRISKGISFQVLAKHMGTSVEMIERHYGHNKIDEWAVELAG